MTVGINKSFDGNARVSNIEADLALSANTTPWAITFPQIGPSTHNGHSAHIQVSSGRPFMMLWFWPSLDGLSYDYSDVAAGATWTFYVGEQVDKGLKMAELSGGLQVPGMALTDANGLLDIDVQPNGAGNPKLAFQLVVFSPLIGKPIASRSMTTADYSA